MDHPFRSAAFGGFNRQDVLDYLEKTAAENAQKQQELQRCLEEAEEDRRKPETDPVQIHVHSSVSGMGAGTFSRSVLS